MSLSSPAEYHYPHYDSTTPVGHKRLLTDSKEVNWAIGGAALGLTVAIVEYIANNVFEGSNGQVAERRRGDYYSSQQARSKKNKKFQDFLYDQKYPDYYYFDDYSHAFGVDDYNEDERDIEYGSWSKNDLFRLEKAVMTYGWGRWEDIMCHAQLRRGWNHGDVEVSSVIL